jgi:hypothetical protein
MPMVCFYGYLMENNKLKVNKSLATLKIKTALVQFPL